ncbi:MAG: TetR/AcrR family transcriptional regulator [Actinomycetota bacterium]
MTRSNGSVSLRAPSGRMVERRNRDSEVIEAAVAIMAAKGYSAMSVQEVADAVGVLKGSLYHYFSSKEELLFRIIEESYRQADSSAQEAADLGLAPLGELCEYLRREAEWYLTNQDRANIYYTEGRHLTGERFEQMKAWGREYDKRLRRLIEAAQKDESIRSTTDARILTRYIQGSLGGLRTWTGQAFRDRSVEELIEEFLNLTRQALRAQL